VSDLARVEVDGTGTRCVVRVIGEVDMSNAHELGRTIAQAVQKGDTELVVDLTDTEYLDSAGVAVLLRLATRLRARRLLLRVLAPPEAPVRGVLELTGATGLFELVSQLEPTP
jgi:anti-anti-sigma factor